MWSDAVVSRATFANLELLSLCNEESPDRMLSGEKIASIVIGALLYCALSAYIAVQMQRGLLGRFPALKTDWFLLGVSWPLTFLAALCWPVFVALGISLILIVGFLGALIRIPNALIQTLFYTEGKTCCGLNCLDREETKAEPDLERGVAGVLDSPPTTVSPPHAEPPKAPVSTNSQPAAVEGPEATSANDNAEPPTYQEAVAATSTQV
ncbi:hypothetical protein QBC44DRAFT_310693 [Cladorrhinum sp. PSN332]|nr:hypothetical protein QBC44DRAFT_310693 [Cladorrhinum sp. PSN332]